jgi:hypothetical protein
MILRGSLFHCLMYFGRAVIIKCTIERDPKSLLSPPSNSTKKPKSIDIQSDVLPSWRQVR